MSKYAPCGDCIRVEGEKMVMCPYLIIEAGVVWCGRKEKELSRVTKDIVENV